MQHSTSKLAVKRAEMEVNAQDAPSTAQTVSTKPRDQKHSSPETQPITSGRLSVEELPAPVALDAVALLCGLATIAALYHTHAPKPYMVSLNNTIGSPTTLTALHVD